MVGAGIDDVLIANEVVDPAKIDRLVAARGARGCHRGGRFVARRWSSCPGRPSGRVGAVKVLIDVDVLIHRCGVSSPAEALEPGSPRGAQPRRGGWTGSWATRVGSGRRCPTARHSSPRRTTCSRRRRPVLRGAGVTVGTVSAWRARRRSRRRSPTRCITELQAGVYAVMEPELTRHGAAVPVRGGGARHRHQQPPRPRGPGHRSPQHRHGVRAAYPDRPRGAPVVTVSDEHTTLLDRWPASGTRQHQVDLIPGQIRTTFNLHEEVIAVSGGEIVATWPIAARGSSR